MATGTIPQLSFLFSIAGLSVTLSGFSGLVAAFRRSDNLRRVDAYRLRQIPDQHQLVGRGFRNANQLTIQGDADPAVVQFVHDVHQ